MRYGLILALSGLSLVPVTATAQVVVNGGVTLGFALGNEHGKRSDFNPHLEADFGGVQPYLQQALGLGHTEQERLVALYLQA